MIWVGGAANTVPLWVKDKVMDMRAMEMEMERDAAVA
jgi:hypothetical protein